MLSKILETKDVSKNLFEIKEKVCKFYMNLRGDSTLTAHFRVCLSVVSNSPLYTIPKDPWPSSWSSLILSLGTSHSSGS